MLPGLSDNRALYGIAGNSVLDCQVHKRNAALPMPSPCLGHDGIGELRLGIRHSFSASPFRAPVGYVVGVGAEKKMHWVDAGAVVALVKDAQAIGDRADEQFPGDSMGASPPDLSVSLRGDFCAPKYATAFCFPANVTEESLFQCQTGRRMTRPRAEATAALSPDSEFRNEKVAEQYSQTRKNLGFFAGMMASLRGHCV
jgi:hypothetical protein